MEYEYWSDFATRWVRCEAAIAAQMFTRGKKVRLRA